MPRDEEVKMSTDNPTPSPHRSVVVEIGPDTTDKELDELAKSLYEQMSGWTKSDGADDKGDHSG
jgi:hypothetical protein